MKYVSARARFNGSLGGVKVEQFRNLDFTKDKIKDRLIEVNNKIEEVKPFTDEYFFQKETDDRDNGEFNHLITESDKKGFYKYNPNVNDELSEDINICKYLEGYGSYLLNSKDLPRQRQHEYKILSEEDFQRQLNKELATDFKTDEGVVLNTRPSNDYNNLDLKITKKDLNPSLQDNKYGIREKDKELATVLNDYITFKEYLKEELRKIQSGEKSEYKLFELRSMLSLTNDNMILAKQQILGIRCHAKRLGDETPYNDFGEMDYKNVEHIKQCLKYCPMTDSPKPDNMVSHIGYDLKNAVRKLKKDEKIDKIDLEIIDCYNSGYTFEQISNEINRKPNVVTQRLKKICKCISKVI